MPPRGHGKYKDGKRVGTYGPKKVKVKKKPPVGSVPVRDPNTGLLELPPVTPKKAPVKGPSASVGSVPVKYTTDHPKLSGQVRIDPGGGIVAYGGKNKKQFAKSYRERQRLANAYRRAAELAAQEDDRSPIARLHSGASKYGGAFAKALGESAVGWLMERANAPQQHGGIYDSGLGRLAQNPAVRGVGTGAEAMFGLQFDPNTGRFIMGQDYDPAWAIAGFGLGIAGVGSPIHAEAALGKQAISHADEIARIAKGLKGRKVWSPHLNQWVETAEPVARSRTGRAVERLTEKARKRVHQTPLSVPLSKARLSLNGDQKIMEEISRTVQRTAVKLDEADPKAIILKGRKLTTAQKYAYLLIAEGIPPNEQVMTARTLVKRYLQQGDTAKAAAQAYQADMLEQAAQFVKIGEDGRVYLADDAPKVMHEIMAHWEKSSAYREDLYQNMGLLTKEQIYNRIQAPGRKHQRRAFSEWQANVKESETRNQIRRDVMDLGWPSKKAEKAALDLFDAEAFSLWNQAVDEKEIRWEVLNDMMDMNIGVGNYQAEYDLLKSELDEFGSFADSTPRDLFWSQLGGVFSAFPTSVGRWMNAEDTISKLHNPWAMAGELMDQGLEVNQENMDALARSIHDLLQAGMDDPSWFDFSYRRFLSDMAPEGNIESWRNALTEADLKTVDNIVASIQGAHGDRNLRRFKTNDWGDQDLRSRVTDMVAYAKAGAFSKDWYARSANIFKVITGGDAKMTEDLVALAAVYSSADEVVPNLGRALKAWRQHKLGQPVKAGRFGAQDVEAQQILDNGVEAWAGTIKRSNFFKNIMNEINPDRANELFPDAHDVTVDRWMFDVFGFDRENTSNAYYEVISDAVKSLGEQWGWEPQEVQAAVWVAIKKDAFKTPSAEALAKMSPEEIAAREARDWRKADRSFEEVLDDTLPYRVRFPVEARPGDESILPNYDSWTDEQQLAHLVAKSEILNEWFKASGLPFRMRETGAGFWITESGELQINPAIAFDLNTGVQWSKKTAAEQGAELDLDAAQRELYDFVTAGAGYINRQQAGAWFAPTMAGGIEQRTLGLISLGRKATKEEMAKIAEAFKGTEVWFSHADDGVFAGWADWMPIGREEYNAKVKNLDLDGEVIWFDHRNNYLEDIDAAFREAGNRGGSAESARLADDLRQRADEVDRAFAADPAAATARVRAEHGAVPGGAEPSPAVRLDYGKLEVGDYVRFTDEQGAWKGTITKDNGDTFSIKLDTGGTHKIPKGEVEYQPRGTGPGGEFVYGKRPEGPYAGLSRETLNEMDASREADFKSFDLDAVEKRIDTLEKEIEAAIKDRAQALGGRSAFFASGGKSKKPAREWEPGVGRRGAIGGAPGRYIEDMGPTKAPAPRRTAHENSLRVAEQQLIEENGDVAAKMDELQKLRDLRREESYPEWARRRLTAPHAGPQTTAGVTYNFDPNSQYWQNDTFAALLPDLMREHGDPDVTRQFVALKEQVGAQAPGQILFHEMTHYLDRITRDLNLPMQAKIRRLGTEGGYYDPEKVAQAMEQYLIEGSTKGGPEADALNELAAHAMEDYAKIRRIIGVSEEDFAGMIPEESWLPPQFRELFDAMFMVEGKRNEGRWAPDPSDWDKGQFYLAVKRGLPHSWRQPYRRMSAYRRNVSLMIAPGRKGALNMMGMDEATRHQWQGFLRDMGFFKNDLTGAMGESGVKAARLGSLAKFKEEVVKMATRVPQNADDIPIRLFPDYSDDQVAKAMRQARFDLGDHATDTQVYRAARSELAKEKKTANQDLSRLRDLMDDMEFGRRKVDYSDFDAMELPEIEAWREMHFPKALEGESIDEVVRQMLNSEVDEIPGIVWIARDALDATGFTTRSINTGQMDDLLKLAGYSFDAMNAWPKMFLLQLNPAYYTMNLIGNGAMMLMQQGVFGFGNAYKASLLSRSLGEEWASVVDNLMGSGVMKLSDVEMGRHALGPLNFLPHLASNIVDKIPRRAAWLHEADRVGIKGSDQLKNLLSMAHDGNQDAVRIIDHITRRANDALVDYERLNPFEKKILTRVIFFYPWIKGATRWTMRFPLEHPVQAAAYASMFGLQQWAADKYIDPDRPWYNWLDVPLPLTADRYGNPVRYVWNPRQALTFTTPLEMAQTILKFAGAVESGQPLAGILTPVLESSLIALAGRRPFDNADTEMNFGTFMGELWGLPPIVKKFQELGKSTEDRLYPRTVFDQALAIAFGSLAPKPIDPELAKWRGNAQYGIPPNREWEQTIKLYEKITGAKVPKDIHEAAYSKLGWEYLRLEARKKKGSALTEKEQLALLWEYARKVNPELEAYDESVAKYLANPTAYGPLRYQMEKLLRWDVLSNIGEYTSKAKAQAGVEPEEEWNP